MKPRLRALLLALCLLLTLTPAVSATGVTFVSVNDDLLDLGLYTPVTSGGVTYLPASIFSGSLGIVFSHNVASKTASLYTASRTLYFDLTDSFSYDTQGNFFETGAVVRDGRVLVPLDFVCSYFGLSYTWNTVTYGTLFRLVNGSQVLSDEIFISAAEQSMRRRYNAWVSTETGPTQTPTTTPTPTPDPEPATQVAIRLCLTGPLDDTTAALLDRLDQLGIPCVWFTDIDSLSAYPDLVRRMTGTGHALAAADADPEAIDTFCAALREITLGCTRLVRCLPEHAEALQELGYIPCARGLTPDLTAPEDGDAHDTALAVAQELLERARSSGRDVALELTPDIAADFLAQLVVELGRNCTWQATTELNAR